MRWSGYLIQMRSRTTTCYPGFVNIRGETYPPPQDKLSSVVLKPGSVQARTTLMPWSRSGKKWTNVETDDLAKLYKLTKEPKWEARAVGPILGCCRPMVSAVNEHNALKALLCRVFRDPGVQPEPGIWEWSKQFRSVLLPTLPRDVKVMDFEDWISTFEPRRKRLLRQAAEEYQRYGFLPKHKKFTAFVKQELLPSFQKTEHGLQNLESMVDRLIQAPHDVTHVIAGPFLRSFLKELKKQWDVDGPVFYASTTPVTLQAWLEQCTKDDVPLTVFWADYTMFDVTHNDDTWKFMRWLYNKETDTEFRKVMDAWQRPRGSIKGFRYRGPAMNASGRDDTALANAILNGFAMSLSAAAAYLGCDLWALTPASVQRCLGVIKLAVCGDDSLGWAPAMSEEERYAFLQRLRTNIARFGFKAKAFASDRPEDGVFLAHRPLKVNGRYVWSRTLGRCLYKLGWQVGVYNGTDSSAWMHGVFDMHRRISSHVPVLSDIVDAYMADAAGRAKTPCADEWRQNFTGVGERYDESTIVSLAAAYTHSPHLCRGDLNRRHTVVTVDWVKDLIAYVREAVKAQVTVLDHPLLELMVELDEQ